MHAPTLLASLALCGLASAIPAPGPSPTLPPRDSKSDSDDGSLDMLNRQAAQTAPWVSVDNEGQPIKTYQPSFTTISGTTTKAHDAAPHDLTASVYTWTSWGELTTSTGAPPNPTATGKGGQGAFSRCHNLDGEFAPFCRPSHNSTLLTGNTYYVTWDPDFYNTTQSQHLNQTFEVAVRIDWLNQSSHEYVKLDTYKRVPAAWGYWPFQVENKHLKGHKLNNVTLTLLSSPKGSAEKTNSTALPLAITKPGNPKQEPTTAPKGTGLTIGLPLAFGVLILLVIGLCLWNRKTRRIQLGNIMSRNRKGYTGRHQRRMFGAGGGPKDNNDIQLHDEPLASPPGRAGYSDVPDRPRRDSDALGSLAGSPIHADFEQQGTTGGRNTFRDEVDRQNSERRVGDRY